jgi:putative hemolysin
MVITRPLLVVGEFVPKRPALVDPEGIASRIAAPMALVARLGSLLVWLLRGSTDAGLRLLGIGDTWASESPRTRSGPLTEGGRAR